MYEELQTKNLSSTLGAFSITINDGSGTRTDSSGLTFDQVFGNIGTLTFAPATCSSGTGSYTPATGDGRTFQVYFKTSTMSTWEPMPAQSINFSPFAIEAKQVSGFPASSLLRVQQASGAPGTATALSTTDFTNLQTLLAGTSTQYVQSGSNGAPIPSMSSNPGTPSAGDIWFNSTSKTLDYYDGTAVQTVGTGSGAGTVTSVATGTGLTGGPISSSGTISLATVGTAGTYTKVTTDAYGRVTAGTQITGNDITSGTIGGTTAINTSGNIQTSADVTSRRNFLYDHSGAGPGYVGFQAPATVTTDYTLTWPAVPAASNGQVLVSDTSGNLTWSSLTGAGVYLNGGNSFGAAATLGTNDANTLGFKTNGSTQMTIDTLGNVGIGTTSPAAALDILAGGGGQMLNLVSNPWFQTGNFDGLYLNEEFNNSTVSTGTDTGIHIHPWTGDTRTTNNLFGTWNDVNLISSGNSSNAVGSYNQVVTAASAGAVTNAYGSKNIVTHESSSTMTNAYGDYVLTQITSTGSITNAYGLYVDTLAGTNRWGIYQNGSSDNNYFAGNVGVGTTSPDSGLEVVMNGGTLNAAHFYNTSGMGTSGGLLIETSEGNGTADALKVVTYQGVAPKTMLRVQDYGAAGGNVLLAESGYGNVGIGTTSPAGNLAIDNTGHNATFCLNGSCVSSLSSGGALPESGGTMTGQLVGEDGIVSAPGFSFNGDTGTGIYDVTPGTLGVSAGSTQVMNATSSTVTIPVTTAATSPSTGALVVGGGAGIAQDLHVGWSVYAQNYLSSFNDSSVYSSSSASAVTPTALSTALSATNNDNLDSSAVMIRLNPRNTASNYQNAFIGAVSNTGAGSYTPTIVIGQQTGADSYSERMRIDQNGFVGIGTTSPVSFFQAQGGDTPIGSYPTGYGYYLSYYNNATTRNGLFLKAGYYTDTNAPIAQFSAYGGAGATVDRMTILSSGNVGIGTTSPTVPFQVSRPTPGSIASSGTTVTGTGTLFTQTFNVGDTISAYGQTVTIASIASDTSMTTSTAFSPAITAGAPYFRTGAAFSGNTYVGIGTDTPNALLDVELPGNGSVTIGAGGGGNFVTNNMVDWLEGFSTSVYSPTSATSAQPPNGIVLLTNNDSTAGNATSLFFLTKGQTLTSYISSLTPASGFSSPIVMGQQTGATSYAERLRIDESGNVGIGTTSPGGNLAVDNTGHNATLCLNGTCTSSLMSSGGATMTGQLVGEDGSVSSPGFSFTGDTGTGIYDVTPGTLGLSAGGTQAMTATASTVDIPLATAATSSTTGALVVSGGIGSGGSIYSAKEINASEGLFTSGTVNDLYSPTSATRAYPYASDGLASTLSATNFYVADNSFAFTLLSVQNAANNHQNAYIGAASSTGGTTYSPAIVFGQQTGATAYNERMRIDQNGNVGIGTTSPTGPFVVWDSIHAQPFLSVSSSGVLSVENGINPTGTSLVLNGQWANSPTTSITMANGTFSQTSGQYVGVEINPTYDQTSGTAANTDLLINRTETAIGSGAQYLADFQVGSASKFSVTDTGIGHFAGSVGIGTTSPAGNLDVETGSASFIVSGTNFSMGNGAVANGTNSLALGSGAVSSAWFSSAIGVQADAAGWGDVAIGPSATTSGSPSVSIGRAVNSTGQYSMALGVGNATGTAPVVSGSNSLGIFMGDQSGVSVSQNNVMAIMGGNVGIGTTSPGGNLAVDNTGHNATLCLNGSCVTSLTGGGSAAFGDGTSATPSLNFSGDTTTGLYDVSASHTLGFASNGVSVETMTGTTVAIQPTTASTTPTTGALTVAGGVGISGALNVGSGGITSNGGLGTSGDANSAYVPTSSSVAWPYATDSLASTITAANFQPLDSAASFTQFIVKNTSGNSQNAYIGAASTTGAGSYSPVLVFGQQTGATAYAERMRIDQSGNVGIGTTTPNFPVDIENATNDSAGNPDVVVGGKYPIYLEANNPSIGFNLYWNNGAGNNQYGTGSSSNYGGVIYLDQVTGNMYFSTTPSPGNAGANATTQVDMTISSSGNVGIGTTSPTHDLSFGGDASREIWMEANSSAASAGNNMILQAGGSGTNADLAGGNLILNSGDATGIGGSDVAINVTNSNQGSGTTPRSPASQIAYFSGMNRSILLGEGANSASGLYSVLVSLNGGTSYNMSQNDAMSIMGGNVGIGTTSAGTTLEVNGGVRAGSSTVVTATCNSTNEGIQRYNYTSHTMEFCNGTIWTTVGAAATAPYVPTSVVYSTTQTNGAAGSYAAMNALCASGYHMCTANDIAMAKMNGVTVPNTSSAWFATAIGYYNSVAWQEDCSAWTSSSSSDYGPAWDNNKTTTGDPDNITCNTSAYVLCCK